MDGRIALAPGTRLMLPTRGGTASYTIASEVGRGASSIVYDASYADNLGNPKLVRVKECCPYALRLARGRNGRLLADGRDAEAFRKAQAGMREAYQRNHDLFSIAELSNSVLATSDFCEANGTVYVVSAWINGAAFAGRAFDSLKACARTLAGAARALQKIHEAGWLYLDLKPENILTIRGAPDLVQLFDFDSLLSMRELQRIRETGEAGPVRISYSRGFAAPELRAGRLGSLGVQSDVYSLGAVLFYALWGRTPTAFDSGADACYEYAGMTWGDRRYQDRLYRALTDFFRRTLADLPQDRCGGMEEAARLLDGIAALSDPERPCILSTPLSRPVCFTGRGRELAELQALLRTEDGRVFALSGMGGIGKSTLVREYLARHREEYDAVVWLFDRGRLQESLGDDEGLQVSTVRRMREESGEEYLRRKLRAVRAIASRQRVLAVLDDLRPEHLNELKPALEAGWQILLISRESLPEGFCPAMRLREMGAADLGALFGRYAHRAISGERDEADFRLIRESVRGHTLTVELLARQIAKGCLTLRETADIAEHAGFGALPADRVDYLRDSQAFRIPLTAVLDRLTEAERFSDGDRRVLRQLAVFDSQGVRAALFRELAGLRDMELITRLAAGGWIGLRGERICMHPLLRQYVRSWPEDGQAGQNVEEMMGRLYEKIRPKGLPEDADRQFPADFAPLLELLDAAERLLAAADRPSRSSRLLRFRLLMDAPVDREDRVLPAMLKLLSDPGELDAACVLRLYVTSAYFHGRMEDYDGALARLEEMKAYLKGHPSHYYRSQYHRAKAVLLHNRAGRAKLEKCLRHEDRAIGEARLSSHPEAPKQLAASLLDKATSLLDAGLEREECGRLIGEAEEIVGRCCGSHDYERYQVLCISAMARAMAGDGQAAVARLREATELARSGQDSPMSLIDHLLDQAAPILLELGRDAEAVNAVREALELCGRYEEAAPYRRKRFDALMFLARIFEETGDYREAAAAYDRAERYRADSPRVPDENRPLCPERVRKAAETGE